MCRSEAVLSVNSSVIARSQGVIRSDSGPGCRWLVKRVDDNQPVFPPVYLLLPNTEAFILSAECFCFLVLTFRPSIVCDIICNLNKCCGLLYVVLVDTPTVIKLMLKTGGKSHRFKGTVLKIK